MTAPTPLSSLSSALADMAARTAPSVVSVHSHRSRATGFAWKPGLIVTADEALADEGAVEIGLADGSTAAATIAGRDHTTDIALLRVDAAVAPVKLAATVPPLGALSVVVATNRETPSAALGMVSTSGKSWRSCAAATSMPGSSSTSVCAAASRAASRSMHRAKPSAWPCSDRGACW